MEELYFTAGSAGVRIDKFLAEAIPDLSRSHIQKLITAELVTVGDKAVKANYKTAVNDEIKVQIPEPEIPDIQPEIFLWTFYMKMKIF